MADKKAYRLYYLLGFEDMAENSVDMEIDLKPFTDRVLNGASVYEIAAEVAKKVMGPLEISDRAEFEEIHAEEIRDEKLDKSTCYREYTEGRTDELRRVLEHDLIAAMDDELSDDDEGDEDGDDELSDADADDDDDEEGDDEA